MIRGGRFSESNWLLWCLVVGSIFFVLAIGEIGIRVAILERDGLSLGEWHRFSGGTLGATTLDDTLGWRATENYHSRRSEKTATGRDYYVDLVQDENGFRAFGRIGSSKVKILFLGDSFTQAREVSNEKTYYQYVKQQLNVEVFAYGVEGYGTLQEYLVLDRHLDVVKPDLVVWQFCFNDLLNNDPDLEQRSAFHNNSRLRPYWKDGGVVYLFPRDSLLAVRIFAVAHSRFLNFLLGRIDKFAAMYLRESLESEIARQGLAHSGLSRAAGITGELMGRVRARAGSVPIVAFNCKAVEPYNTALRDISQEHDILFLDEIAATLESAGQRGEDVFHADGAHWSEEGHRVVGEALAEHLKMLISEGKLLVPFAAAR